jgi:hypothetical protein
MQHEEKYKVYYESFYKSLKAGDIIHNSFKYFKVLGLQESDKKMFGEHVVVFTLQEVRFQRSTWSWVALDQPFTEEYNLFTMIRLSKPKPVDYVLFGDTLYDENGDGIDTYLAVKDDEFDDQELKTRFLVDGDVEYDSFRKEFNIIDQYNTVEAYVQEKAVEERKLTIEEERQRKLKFLQD